MISDGSLNINVDVIAWRHTKYW